MARYRDYSGTTLPLPMTDRPPAHGRRRPATAAGPAFVALTLAAALAGCDAPLPLDDGACASIGVSEAGSVEATTPAGPFRTTCASVGSGGGSLLVIAREPGSGALGGATLELYVGGTEPGTYVFGDDAVSGAAFGPGPDAVVGARSGSVTVESFEGGVRGTFAFVTLTGAEVTDGRFDLDL